MTKNVVVGVCRLLDIIVDSYSPVFRQRNENGDRRQIVEKSWQGWQN